MKNPSRIAYLHKIWQPMKGCNEALKNVLQQEDKFFSANAHIKANLFPHIQDDLLNAWNTSKHKADIFKIEQWLVKNRIQMVSILDDEYPSLLRNLTDPPVILYFTGNLSMLKFGIGIVGSRHADDYGLQSAYQLGMELSRQNITVVSGLAKGIDAYGHKGALEGAGGTIAVQGCGLDTIYPKSNQQLAKSILEHPNSCIVSEFALGTPPEGWHFPRRNRIISAFSRGLVVIQATNKSGVYSTVESALNMGKDVFAVPGEINNPLSYGPNKFIQEGAMLITGTKDILQYYDIPLEEDLTKSHNRTLKESSSKNSQTKNCTENMLRQQNSRDGVNFHTCFDNLDNIKDNFFSTGQNILPQNSVISDKLPTENWELPSDILLTDDEKNVLLLFQRDSLQFDDLVKASGKSVAELSAILSMLEVYGLLEQQLGRNYMRIR